VIQVCIIIIKTSSLFRKLLKRELCFFRICRIFFWLIIGSGLCYSTKGDPGGREKNSFEEPSWLLRSVVYPWSMALLPLGPTTTAQTERIIHFSDGPLQYPFLCSLEAVAWVLTVWFCFQSCFVTISCCLFISGSEEHIQNGEGNYLTN
jgi:hypothetical protein